MHIHMDTYIYMHMHIYVHIHIHIYIYMHMHIYIYVYIYPQLVHASLCNGAAASLPWKLLRTYLESCANIVQAVVSARPPAPSSSRPPSCQPVARRCLLENSVQIHASSGGRRCGVAQASSDHPRWCGPHPVCLCFTLAHGRGPHP